MNGYELKMIMFISPDPILQLASDNAWFKHQLFNNKLPFVKHRFLRDDKVLSARSRPTIRRDP